jgi:predicted HNH restriction endonuclease
MSWINFTKQVITDFCNEKGSRTFTLEDIYTKTPLFQANNPDNLHIEEKIRQTLQFLRDDGILTFVDNRGTYTLRSIELLKGEVDDDQIVNIKCKTPEKKEYLIETFVRDIGWAKAAKETFGLACMYNHCLNTFNKENGEPYIEIHHIIPLCRGGEDGLWNLSVLCAHHHRMAHYADTLTCIKMEKYLLKEAECQSRI